VPTDPEGLPVHRVAAVVWMDMPARTYGEASRHVDVALERWLDQDAGRQFTVYSAGGGTMGEAEIVSVDTLGHALTSGRLTLTPPLWETPARVREAAATLDRGEAEASRDDT
jgi:hypothetical protein